MRRWQPDCSIFKYPTGPLVRTNHSRFEIAGLLSVHPSISRKPVFSVNSAHSSKERRRSERLFEALPLIVRGTDLLGQPFEERTSTLAFNLHGCQYTSKHHLPRNSWVTLELPDAHSNVRARVAWVQRPHSIREFFQVAVELERPTNVWKQGQLPENWLKTETQFPTSGHTETAGTARAADTGTGAVATTLGHFMNAQFHDTSRDSAVPLGADSEAAHPLLRDLRADFERANQQNRDAPQAEAVLDSAAVPVAEPVADESKAATASEISYAIDAGLREFRTQLEQLRARIQSEFSELLNARAKEMADGLRAEADSNSARAHELMAQSIVRPINSAPKMTLRSKPPAVWRRLASSSKPSKPRARRIPPSMSRKKLPPPAIAPPPIGANASNPKCHSRKRNGTNCCSPRSTET